jgi:hypothetical protein
MPHALALVAPHPARSHALTLPALIHALPLPAVPHALATVHSAVSHALALVVLLPAPGAEPALALGAVSLAIALLLLSQGHTSDHDESHDHCCDEKHPFHVKTSLGFDVSDFPVSVI